MFVGIGMFAAKITAYFITDSSAIFSDAAESVVHVIATSMALFSIVLSSKPPDKSHLYGHGNVEYFSAGIEGLLIIIAALAIIFISVKKIISGIAPEELDLGIIIISAAGFINLFLGFYLIKKGKQTNSLALIADGKHVLTDSYTSIGVIIGLILVLVTGFVILDPLFAILVAINILFTGYKLLRQSIGGLMNETDEEKLDKIIITLRRNKKDFWIDIHDLRFWESAEKTFIDFHLILPFYFTIQMAHEEEDRIIKFLREEFNYVQLKVHLDYCNENLCKFCDYTNCQYRTQKKEAEVKWNTEKMIGKPIL